jgi:hypothetical protein
MVTKLPTYCRRQYTAGPDPQARVPSGVDSLFWCLHFFYYFLPSCCDTLGLRAVCLFFFFFGIDPMFWIDAKEEKQEAIDTMVANWSCHASPSFEKAAPTH